MSVLHVYIVSNADVHDCVCSYRGLCFLLVGSGGKARVQSSQLIKARRVFRCALPRMLSSHEVRRIPTNDTSARRCGEFSEPAMSQHE